MGALGSGKAVAARERTGHRVVRAALCILLFVLYILLISIVVVTVHFIFCSVKLPLSRPTSFCLFLSILLPTPATGGAIERPRGPVASHRLNHNNCEVTCMLGFTSKIISSLEMRAPAYQTKEQSLGQWLRYLDKNFIFCKKKINGEKCCYD